MSQERYELMLWVTGLVIGYVLGLITARHWWYAPHTPSSGKSAPGE